MFRQFDMIGFGFWVTDEISCVPFWEHYDLNLVLICTFLRQRIHFLWRCEQWELWIWIRPKHILALMHTGYTFNSRALVFESNHSRKPNTAFSFVFIAEKVLHQKKLHRRTERLWSLTTRTLEVARSSPQKWIRQRRCSPTKQSQQALHLVKS